MTNTSTHLKGKKVAILVTDGFEQVELTEPKKALESAGASTKIVAPAGAQSVKGYEHLDAADDFRVDQSLTDAKAEDFDALLLPGGVANPDALRIDDKAVAFVKAFVQAGKPIAAICHGPWTLIEAGGVKGKKMTSWPSLKTDLTHAGGQWTDQSVVVDQGLVTSRKPEDLPDFNREMLKCFAQAGTSTQ